MHLLESKHLDCSIKVPVPDSHADCMVCGKEALGLHFYGSPNGVEAFFQASTRWQGYSGVLHGGMICTLLDAAMTHCLFQQGIEAMTADLQVRFLKPVPCTARLQLHATLQNQRRNLYQLSAELSCDGDVLARSEARFLRRKQYE